MQAIEHEVDHPDQNRSVAGELGELTKRGVTRQPSLFLGPTDAVNSRIRRLGPCLIDPNCFTCIGGVAGHVQQIIHDLEGQSELRSIRPERPDDPWCGVSGQSPKRAGGRNQSRCFGPVDRLQSGRIRRVALGFEVENLTPDHPLTPDRRRKAPNNRPQARRQAWRRLGCSAEGQKRHLLQRGPGRSCNRCPVYPVCSRQPASERVVVHAG